MKIELQKLESIVLQQLQASPLQPKYQAVYAAIKEGIVSQRLPDLCELPATRPLAEALNLSRSTVIKAYELLKLEGYIDALEGSAYRIRSLGIDPLSQKDLKSSGYSYVSLSESATAFGSNAPKLNSIDNEGVAFRPGVPPLDLFPIEKWRKLQNEYWQFVRASELTYHSGAGTTALRKTLANYLKLRRGIQCDYRQVFVVGGSLQSLFLIGSLLANPGDSVYVEDPTFPNVHSVFKGLRTQTRGIPIDSEGMDLHYLEAQLNPLSKLVHITPSCHYPFGNQMSINRKKELLNLADRQGFYLIENDYEHEINFPNHDGHPLFSLDKQDRSFYISTFNRTMHPSIRVGFVVVPFHLIASFEALIMHSHRSISPVLQTVLRGFIEKKFLHDHLNNVSKQAAVRHRMFIDRLQKYLSEYLEPLPSQTPSLHIVCKLKNGQSDTAVVQKLLENEIIAHPLSKCYVHKPLEQGLIFGFSSVRPQYLDAHFAKLIKGIKS